MTSKKFDILVLGAGAAGLFYAQAASQKGLRLAVIDHAEKIGQKFRIAGGGMGNVTNRTLSEKHYIGDTGVLARLLRKYDTAAMIRLLSSCSIPLEERDFGQIFCLTPAARFVEALKSRCQQTEFFLGKKITKIFYTRHAPAEAPVPLSAQPASVTAEESSAASPANTVVTAASVTAASSTNTAVTAASPAAENTISTQTTDEILFHICTEDGEFTAPCLVVATGSPACPQIAATDFGTRLARKWSHQTADFRPVLTPFLMPDNWALRDLSGISVPAAIRVRRSALQPQNSPEYEVSAPALAASSTAAPASTPSASAPASPACSVPPARKTKKSDKTTQEFSDPCGVRSLLFTHHGISGPAGLVASCFWTSGDELIIDFLPESNATELLHAPENGKKLVKNCFLPLLPDRLVYALLPADLLNKKVAELPKKDRQRIHDALHTHTVTPTGTEGFRKAEAAAGGVLLSELTSNFESKKIAGLFFIGEVLNITGLLGGYNLHFAFASARRAAEAVGK